MTFESIAEGVWRPLEHITRVAFKPVKRAVPRRFLPDPETFETVGCVMIVTFPDGERWTVKDAEVIRRLCEHRGIPVPSGPLGAPAEAPEKPPRLMPAV